jgi:quercetin dioxygenase-like cupin family protein
MRAEGSAGGDQSMQVLSKFEWDLEAIARYSSRSASSARLEDGFGEAHAYMLQFEPGGVIGQHEAGFGQLFVVLVGSGWVSGADGSRAEVEAGDVVYFERGEQHAKGSVAGMQALMVQVRDLSPPGSTAVD